MSKNKNLNLENQIEKLNRIYLEINTSFYIIENELKELSKIIAKFEVPKLDFTLIDLNGGLHEFKK